VTDDQEETETNRSGNQGGVAGDMIRGSLWTLVSAVVGIPLAFAVNLVVARTLGPAGLGTLATYAAVVGVATTVLNMGISQSTVQWIAETRVEDYGPERLHLIRNCVGYHALVQGPAVAAVVFFLLRSSSPWVWTVAVFAILATCVLGTSSVILTATARNAVAAKLALVTGIALQAATVGVALETRSASETYAAQLIAGALGAALCFLVVRHDERNAFFHPLVLRRLPAGFLSYGLSACGAALVGTLVFGRSEIFVLQWHGLKVAAGEFALATGLAGQITVPMDSVMGPLLPTATRLLAAVPSRATETATRSIRVSSVLASLTMATAIPLVYIAIPLLFGHQFRQARSPFLLLGIVSCLQSVTVPLSMLVFATRNASSVLRINLICLLVDAALAIGLVPILGLWGAVLANAGAQLLSLGLLTAVGVKMVHIDAMSIGRAGRPLILGLGAAGLSVICDRLIPVPTWTSLFVMPLIAVAALIVGFGCLPEWRVTASDSALVELSLPRRLRPLFQWTTRTLNLAAVPAAGRF